MSSRVRSGSGPGCWDLFSSFAFICLFCRTSEATFWKKTPVYSLDSEEPPGSQECLCECPKDKFIQVEVPKTQVQYFPIDEKDLQDNSWPPESNENGLEMPPDEPEYMKDMGFSAPPESQMMDGAGGDFGPDPPDFPAEVKEDPALQYSGE